MSSKRAATNDLNHENWDQEEEPEDRGHFRAAPEQELKARVIRKARRTITGKPSGETKSIFGNFSGFGKTTDVSAKPSTAAFSFLSKVNTAGTSAGAKITDAEKPQSSNTTCKRQKADNDDTANTQNEAESEQKLPSIIFGKKTDNSSPLSPVASGGFLFKSQSNAPANNNVETSKQCDSTDNKSTEKAEADTKIVSPEYMAKVASLNLQFSDYIKSTVTATPNCILTPIFKDYQKYIDKIDEDEKAEEDNKNEVDEKKTEEKEEEEEKKMEEEEEKKEEEPTKIADQKANSNLGLFELKASPKASTIFGTNFAEVKATPATKDNTTANNSGNFIFGAFAASTQSATSTTSTPTFAFGAKPLDTNATNGAKQTFIFGGPKTPEKKSYDSAAKTFITPPFNFGAKSPEKTTADSSTKTSASSDKLAENKPNSSTTTTVSNLFAMKPTEAKDIAPAATITPPTFSFGSPASNATTSSCLSNFKFGMAPDAATKLPTVSSSASASNFTFSLKANNINPTSTVPTFGTPTSSFSFSVKPNDSKTDNVTSTSAATITSPNIPVGSQTTLGTSFFSSPSTSGAFGSPSSIFSFGGKSNEVKAANAESSTITSSTTTTPTTSIFPTSPFSFGGNNTSSSKVTNGFSFAQKSDSTPTSSSVSTFSFVKPGDSSSPQTAGFSFKPNPSYSFGNVAPSTSTETETETTENENEDTPPKVEFQKVVEDDAIYSQRCKVFIKKEKDYTDRGIGTLYLKPIKDTKKYQLLVRADTNLGNILLNVILNEALPTTRMGKNNVMIVCLPTAEFDAPTSVLLRVKTGEDADTLLQKLDECKGQSKRDNDDEN